MSLLLYCEEKGNEPHLYEATLPSCSATSSTIACSEKEDKEQANALQEVMQHHERHLILQSLERDITVLKVRCDGWRGYKRTVRTN